MENCPTSQFCFLPPLHPRRQPRLQKTPGEATSPLILGASGFAQPSLLCKLHSWKWKIMRCEMTLLFPLRAEKL